MDILVVAALSTEAKTHLILAVIVVLVAARFAGWLFSKIGQPRVCGELMIAIALGPSLLGMIYPGATEALFPDDVRGALAGLAQIGLILFMFLIGFELDLPSLRATGHKAVMISHASIVAPIVGGVVLGMWLHPRIASEVDRLGFILFLGAAMAITAFPVLARVLQETGLNGTRLGALTLTCAAVDDVTAWCVLAIVVAVVTSSGPGDVVQIVGYSLAFVAAMLFVARPALARLHQHAVWVAIAVAFASAWVTELIGIHAIFGAFMAGLVMPRRSAQHVTDRLEAVTVNLLLPVFFVLAGLSTRVDLLDSVYLWGLAGLVIATAVAGKWGGSMLVARYTGETWRDANTIGVLMNTRGLTELVILSIGLDLGVINDTVYTIMVLMALVTTLMAAPVLRLLSRIHVAAVPEPHFTIDPHPVIADHHAA
jgi:Kef-type K+ transport system membrane component KefB